MSSAAAYRMTLDEFLEWEELQELRYEFDGLEVFAMTGGTAAHSALMRNLAIFIGGPLLQRGGPCRFFGDALKIRTRQDTIRYPDGLVTCTPGPRTRTVEAAPVIVFEVLSPSSQRTDREAKLAEYLDTPSIRRYVMLASDAVQATVFARGDGGAWEGVALDAAAMLEMPEIELSLPLAELNRDSGLLPSDLDA